MHANLYISVALSRNTSLHVEEPSQIYKKKKKYSDVCVSCNIQSRAQVPLAQLVPTQLERNLCSLLLTLSCHSLYSLSFFFFL